MDFPPIECPCPAADRLDEVLDGDFCRACNKQVLDLDSMTRLERLRALGRATGLGGGRRSRGTGRDASRGTDYAGHPSRRTAPCPGTRRQ